SPSPTPTPTTSPTPGCVLTSGYWMNHPQAWCMKTIQLGCVTYTEPQAIAILRHNSAQDKTYSLAQQLIAAKLDITCKNSNSSCIAAAITAADNWLCAHPVGSGVTASSSAWRQISATFDRIVDYVEGRLCAPSCDSPRGFNKFGKLIREPVDGQAKIEN